MTAPVITRFAPSPTGFLHIGGARTALFNWLYARGRGGKFLLRIEDTDRERSSPEATEAILQGMAWLGLEHDGEVISQFEGAARHREVALHLLEDGKAYKCFATQDEIAAFREAARAEGKSTLFQSPWRDAQASTHPDMPHVIRIKSPQTGETVIRDQVQGDVTIRNDQLDDMVLLRSDGTPVYMLAVVVDDHDMGVTHVIATGRLGRRNIKPWVIPLPVCAIIWPVWGGATGMMNFSPTPKRLNGLIWTGLAKALRGLTLRSSKTCVASTLQSRMMLHCGKKSKVI